MIEVFQADITKIDVDVIVNAANNSLLGGGGVDGAIHSVAGKGLLNECRGLNGCETGEAKITLGYNLSSKYVIHTVGPIWRDGSNNEEQLLANCYKNSLALALKYNCKTIAFSNISTGVYNFPKKLAAKIAIYEIKQFSQIESFEIVVFVCFDYDNLLLYQSLLK